MQRQSRQQSARPQPGRVMPNSYQQPPIPVNRPPAAQGQIRIQPPIQQPPRQILSASQRMRAIKVSAATGQRQLPPMPHPSPYPIMPQPSALPQRKSQKKGKSSGKNFLLIVGLILVGMFSFACMSITVGMMGIYGNGILPGVQAAGVNLGGMSQQEAEIALRNQWTALTLRDGDREFASVPGALGIQLDAAQTAQMAFEQGRGGGNVFGALIKTEVSPIVIVDMAVLTAGLEALAPQVEIPAVNAGVELVNGQVQATPPITGRALDINATAAHLQNDAALASGILDLVMADVQPTVTDSSAMVQAAQQLLTNPLNITVYDPATGDSVIWSAPPETWARWLTSNSAPDTATGLSLSVQDAPVRDFLTAQSGVFDQTRYVNIDEAVGQVQEAVAVSNTNPSVRVYHHDQQYVVQAGDTIVSVGYDFGVPYLYVQQANQGVETLSVGQTITIPSVDNFLPYPIVANKRIVVSMPEQRVRVYENGALIQDWASSTGISSSPTWPGVYQIISHEVNAYAGNWNLWMPNFMGVYQPIPGADFTNGFHGFPTRGGGQILWENSLGTRVTYGCILLSNANAQWLYNWAEEGVVVEIQG